MKLPCRSASPELWRANRTAQHLEDDFGMLSPDAKINPTRQQLPAGNHIEERIRRRAEIDAKAETGEFRAVRYNIFITLIQYYVVNFYFMFCSHHLINLVVREVNRVKVGLVVVPVLLPEVTVKLDHVSVVVKVL